MKYLFLLILPFTLFSNQYYGDTPEHFSAKIVKNQAALSLKEKNNVEIEVLYPLDFHIKEVSLNPSPSEPPITCISQLVESVASIESHQKEKINLSYEPQVEGTHILDLPIIHFESNLSPNQTYSLYPPSIECEILLDSANTLDGIEALDPLSMDLTPPIELDRNNKNALIKKSEEDLKQAHEKLFNQPHRMHWKTIFLSVGLASLAYFVFRQFRKRKGSDALSKENIDPKDLALKELEELKKKELPKQGFFNDYYSQVTLIVRNYIEGKYQINAPEQTTQEFLEVVLNQSLFQDQHKQYLAEFLKFADLVKFAKHSPQVRDCDDTQDAAKAFILNQDGLKETS